MKITYDNEIIIDKLSDNEFKEGLKHYPTITGEADEYLNMYLDAEELNSIPSGKSIIVNAPVGSGKTTAIINALTHINNNSNIYILTNRKYSKVQIKRDVLRKIGINVDDWTESAILQAHTHNIKVLTYQELAMSESLYIFKKGSMLIMDECHYFTSDATFSTCPSRITEIIRANIDNTIRVYISATMDDVIGTVCQLEYEGIISVNTVSDTDSHNRTITKIPRLRIHKIYSMKSSWNHVSVRYYSYNSIDKLTTLLNADSEENQKSIVFTRSIARGKQFEELLSNSSLVYSSDAENEVLSSIALNEHFEASSLISTKVLENGISITDDSIKNIVIEEPDLVTAVQFFGRVRTKRKNPRSLTLWIPDFTLAELKHFKAQYSSNLDVIRKVIENPEYCMRNFSNYTPYVYYSENGPKANMLAYKKNSMMYSFIDKLIEVQTISHHAFIHAVLTRLGLPDEIDDSQFINYDDISTFKSGIAKAYEVFALSEKLKADRDKLAKELIKVVNSTSFYGKKITSNQLQVDKINEILALADISDKLYSKGEVFGII